MPTTPLKNLVYRIRLPLEAPRVVFAADKPDTGNLHSSKELLRILREEHVLGASVLLKDGSHAETYIFPTVNPDHPVNRDSVYRIASITKTVTATAALVLVDRGLLDPEAPVSSLLPDASDLSSLRGITLKHLLSHTSSLRDTQSFYKALESGETYRSFLSDRTVRAGEPGTSFHYCNAAFGLIGSLIETVTGDDIDTAVHNLVLTPLGMNGTLYGYRLPEERIMPMTRVLPYRKGGEMRVTEIGRRCINGPDPMRHFGFTAGSLYTDPASLSLLLDSISGEGTRILSDRTLKMMTTVQSVYGKSSPTLSYGLGLLFINDPRISDSRLIGHQGFAYGCGNGAFYEESTGRQIVFLNGGCSEAREGHMGRCNRRILSWAFRKEFDVWR